MQCYIDKKQHGQLNCIILILTFFFFNLQLDKSLLLLHKNTCSEGCTLKDCLFLQRRQEELERKEEELARREEEMRHSSYNVRRNNWPPLPEQCCFQPCFYQDIQVDIPLEFQKIVRNLYYLWICKFYNFCSNF